MYVASREPVNQPAERSEMNADDLFRGPESEPVHLDRLGQNTRKAIQDQLRSSQDLKRSVWDLRRSNGDLGRIYEDLC